MRSIFLMIFGVLGLAITCLQGVEPFIDLSKWVAWVTGYWVYITRWVWTWLASWVGLKIPNNLADCLTGISYLAALCICFKRSKSFMGSSVDNLAMRFDVLILKLERFLRETRTSLSHSRVMSFLFDRACIFAAVVFLGFPIYLVYCLVLYASIVQGITLGVALFLLPFMASKLPAQPKSKFINYFRLISDHEPLTAYGPGTFLVAYSFAATVVLGVLVVVLVLNEIALHGDNLLALYKWAKCDAGIKC